MSTLLGRLGLYALGVGAGLFCPWYVDVLVVFLIFVLWLMVRPQQGGTYTGPNEDEITGGPCCRKPKGPCPCVNRKRWTEPIEGEDIFRFPVVKVDDPADPERSPQSYPRGELLTDDVSKLEDGPQAARRRIFSYDPFATERHSQQFYRRHRDELPVSVDATKPEDLPKSDAPARVISFNCPTCGNPTTVDGTDESFACEHCRAKHFI